MALVVYAIAPDDEIKKRNIKNDYSVSISFCIVPNENIKINKKTKIHAVV